MDLLRGWKGIAVIAVLVFSVGCASSGTTSRGSSSGNSGSEVEVDNASITLADYLRRLSGVTVQGYGNNISVLVRGAQTVSGNNEPLFIINGSRAGRSYQQVASMVDVSDIDRIRVIKGSEAGSRYGLEGSAGVIIIRTKKN